MWFILIYVDSELRINKRKSILYTDCLVFLGIRNNLSLLTIMFASVSSKKKNKMKNFGAGHFDIICLRISPFPPTDLRIYLGKLSFYARLRHWKTENIETLSRKPRKWRRMKFDIKERHIKNSLTQQNLTSINKERERKTENGAT